MIIIKTKEQIKKMRRAGKLAARVLFYIEDFIKPGISTEEINNLCHNFIIKHNGHPAPLNYKGFPKSVCVSVNDTVCHGISSPGKFLKDGDIVNIDVMVSLDGWHGDTSKTFLVGNVGDRARLLVERTEKAMYRGIEVIKPGVSIYKIGQAIEKYVSKFGYAPVHSYGGHGIGRKFHEDPHIYHFDPRGWGEEDFKMQAGMTFTVEPMINIGGSSEVYLDEKTGWEVKTEDGDLSAQFEHTVAVTETGYEILTKIDE